METSDRSSVDSIHSSAASTSIDLYSFMYHFRDVEQRLGYQVNELNVWQ